MEENVENEHTTMEKLFHSTITFVFSVSCLYLLHFAVYFAQITLTFVVFELVWLLCSESTIKCETTCLSMRSIIIQTGFHFSYRIMCCVFIHLMQNPYSILLSLCAYMFSLYYHHFSLCMLCMLQKRRKIRYINIQNQTNKKKESGKTFIAGELNYEH